jgi:hypothetical protein
MPEETALVESWEREDRLLIEEVITADVTTL